MPQCSMCHKSKGITAFYPISKSDPRPRKHCKACHISRVGKWRHTNPAKYRVWYQKWYEQKKQERMASEIETSMQPPDHIIWISLGWRPPLTNEYIRLHWAQKKRVRLHTSNMLHAYMIAHKVPKAEGKRRLQLTLVLGKGRKKGDPDNHWKCLLDAAQDASLLINDSDIGVELLPVRFERSWDNPGTRIEVWEMGK